MDLFLSLMGVFFIVIGFMLIRRSGTKLTAEDYREDLIHKAFNKKD